MINRSVSSEEKERNLSIWEIRRKPGHLKRGRKSNPGNVLRNESGLQVVIYKDKGQEMYHHRKLTEIMI